MDIPACSIYLSKYSTSAALKITASGACNPCTSGSVLSIDLVGSISGIPYGWHDFTSYQVVDKSGNTYIRGTLNTGIIDEHKVCLPNGDYTVGFNQLAIDDEFPFINPSLSSYYGIEEYFLSVSGCGSSLKEINAYACYTNGECIANYGMVAFHIESTGVDSCSLAAVATPPKKLSWIPETFLV